MICCCCNLLLCGAELLLALLYYAAILLAFANAVLGRKEQETCKVKQKGQIKVYGKKANGKLKIDKICGKKTTQTTHFGSVLLTIFF